MRKLTKILLMSLFLFLLLPSTESEAHFYYGYRSATSYGAYFPVHYYNSRYSSNPYRYRFYGSWWARGTGVVQLSDKPSYSSYRKAHLLSAQQGQIIFWKSILEAEKSLQSLESDIEKTAQDYKQFEKLNPAPDVRIFRDVPVEKKKTVKTKKPDKVSKTTIKYY